MQPLFLYFCTVANLKKTIIDKLNDINEIYLKKAIGFKKHYNKDNINLITLIPPM